MARAHLPERWRVGAGPNFNVVARVGTQAITNTHRLGMLLKADAPAALHQASLFKDF